MQPDISLDNIKMSSSDLLEKKELDSGGFGKVSLCFHKSHGFVILKRVYTGPNRAEYNEVLLEEGKMMHRLRHSRVVKLLGIIMEEGNYSLVMEYMEKGNLMHVLKAEVNVPLSVKGRIISETIEGMCYLHDKGVIHKDLKPENILVDRDFHIKIADLGVASFKTWSILTKEKHNKQREVSSRQPRRDAPTTRTPPPAAGRAAGPGRAPTASRLAQGCPGPGGGGGRRSRAGPARQAPVHGRHVHARDPKRRALRHVLRTLVWTLPATAANLE